MENFQTKISFYHQELRVRFSSVKKLVEIDEKFKVLRNLADKAETSSELLALENLKQQLFKEIFGF